MSGYDILFNLRTIFSRRDSYYNECTSRRELHRLTDARSSAVMYRDSICHKYTARLSTRTLRTALDTTECDTQEETLHFNVTHLFIEKNTYYKRGVYIYRLIVLALQAHILAPNQLGNPRSLIKSYMYNVRSIVI